tara:strand:+ start:144 stop:644 length:501 start_codon:yes stop_codon:yes gene_type:complete
MISKKLKDNLLKFLFVLFIFFVDRTSKTYVINLAEGQDKLDLYINPFLNIILVWNTGIAFGLLSFDSNLVYNAITILILFINLFIFYLIIKSEKFVLFSLILVLGGSLGNLYDRLYYSAVPDFIDLNYNGYHWFIFNIADIFITLGIISLILVEILNYKRSNENKN